MLIFLFILYFHFRISLINYDQRFLKWKINPKQKAPGDLLVKSPSFYPNPLHSGVCNGRLDAFHWNAYLISIFDSRLNKYPGADPREVKWVNFHPLSPSPLFLSPLLFFLFFFFLSPQRGFGSITILQKFTLHFKILDPRLISWLSQFIHRFSSWKRTENNTEGC